MTKQEAIFLIGAIFGKIAGQTNCPDLTNSEMFKIFKIFTDTHAHMFLCDVPDDKFVLFSEANGCIRNKASKTVLGILDEGCDWVRAIYMDKPFVLDRLEITTKKLSDDQKRYHNGSTTTTLAHEPLHIISIINRE